MALIKTHSGLIYFDELDSDVGWAHDYIRTGGLNPNFYVDTGNKYSGSAALRTYSYSGSYYMIKEQFTKTLNLGTGSGRRVHVWGRASDHTGTGPIYVQTFKIGGIATWIWSTNDEALSDNTSWAKKSGTIPDAYTGLQVCGVAYSYVEGLLNTGLSSLADRLVICESDNVTVNGLINGQKVEIYRTAGDVLIDTKTATGGTGSVALDVSAEDFPENMYLKIYNVNGITLIETTGSFYVYGGDDFGYVPTGTTLKVTVDNFVIYRQTAVATPKTATITATLYKNDGTTPYPGQTIYFSSLHGTLSASSGVTDGNGQVSVTLTSTTHGLIIVQTCWLGDANSDASVAFTSVHVFYEAEAGDTNKDFQFFCEGKEYHYAAAAGASPGSYALNYEMVTEQFNIELTEYPSDMTYNGLVSIYRKGVKEFAGILKSIERTLESYSVIVSGIDISGLLDFSTITVESYTAKSPEYMIGDLLTKYPCGITAGNLATSGVSMDLMVNAEGLGAAIQRICKMVGYYYRTNIDRTLDFAQQFGSELVAVAFTEGVDIVTGRNKEAV